MIIFGKKASPWGIKRLDIRGHQPLQQKIIQKIEELIKSVKE